ncbi:Uncharacterised protein [Klebsiella pneumoniae]|nr:Uncharacterised protein [Klebsiella pneumoniae]
MDGTDKVAAELAAQMMDVNFHGVAGDLVVPGVELFLDKLTRQYAPGVAHKQFQQGELLRLQRKAFAVEAGG